MTQDQAPRWVGRSLAASAILPVLSTAWNLRESPLSVMLTGIAAVGGALAVQQALRAAPARVLIFSAVAFVASRLVLSVAVNPYGAIVCTSAAALALAIGTVRTLAALGPNAARALVATGKYLAPLMLLQTAGLVYSPNMEWLVLVPTARLSVGGERNAGYLHYFRSHGSVDAVVTIRKADRSETYWLVVPLGSRSSARHCENWTAPALPFIIRGDLSPPCTFEFELGKAQRDRNVVAGERFVEFNADDGVRVIVEWDY